jgi:hypothetical protein
MVCIPCAFHAGCIKPVPLDVYIPPADPSFEVLLCRPEKLVSEPDWQLGFARPDFALALQRRRYYWFQGMDFRATLTLREVAQWAQRSGDGPYKFLARGRP